MFSYLIPFPLSSISSFLLLEINLRSLNMSSRSPHTASLMQSSSGAHVKSKFNGKPGISLKTPLSSHYYDLRQLQPEEDLIELNDEPPTPQTQTEHSNLPLHRSCGSPSESNHGLKRYQAKSSTRVQEQMTLLDLEDPLIQGDSAGRDGRIAGGERSRIGRQS